MSKQEFIDEHRKEMRAYNRRAIRACVVGFLVILVAMFGAKPLLTYLDEHNPFAGDGRRIAYWGQGIGGLALVALAFAGACVSQPHGVRCPSCGRRLFNLSARLAAATGNCAHCGGVVIEDVKAGGPAGRGPSRDDFCHDKK